MRNLLLLGFLSLTILSACDDDDDNSPNNPVDPVQVRSTVQDGQWRITRFVDSGQDETSDFTGYVFTFNSSGVLNATNGTNNYNGTWAIMNDSDDDDSDDVDFIIAFPLTNDFEDLNDDWDFVSQSANKIELIDVSGGNGDTDLLTFEKI